MKPNNEAGVQAAQGKESKDSGRLPQLANTGGRPPKLPREKKPHFDCTVIKPTDKLPTRDLPVVEDVDPSSGDEGSLSVPPQDSES